MLILVYKDYCEGGFADIHLGTRDVQLINIHIKLFPIDFIVLLGPGAGLLTSV